MAGGSIAAVFLPWWRKNINECMLNRTVHSYRTRIYLKKKKRKQNTVHLMYLICMPLWDLTDFVSFSGIMVVRNSLMISGLCLLQGVFDRYFSVCVDMQRKLWAHCCKSVDLTQWTHKSRFKSEKKGMTCADLIHDGVEVLLPGAVFVLHGVLPLFLQVCQQFEHLRNTDTQI